MAQHEPSREQQPHERVEPPRLDAVRRPASLRREHAIDAEQKQWRDEQGARVHTGGPSPSTLAATSLKPEVGNDQNLRRFACLPQLEAWHCDTSAATTAPLDRSR